MGILASRMNTSVQARTRALSLLDVDDELAGAVPEEERAVARRIAVGAAITLAPGPASVLEELSADEAVWGFYVVSGVVVRCVTISHAAVPELVGAGEAIGPPARLDSIVPATESFTVVETAELIVLEESVARAIGRWPLMLAILTRRASLQRLRATSLAAIGHLSSAETRILAVLWHLAETWGKVVVGGTLIPFPFTHATLGQLMGARRPTVSLALVNLDKQGLVKRLGDGSWLLPTGSDAALREMLANGAPAPELVMRARVTREAARDLVDRSSRTRASSEDRRDESSAVMAQADQVRRHREQR